ncbi:pyruvate kinase [Saccharicrinis carchari]|uniref:pyruvate kinase n=1 Tax=Saccharicrinis carchari TaxID=1168039 RepID=A0A521B0F3_SACCC|nr:pyruvate kinase [Saccharicrinis carchari]SMO40509.1 pyruvate kinase [Saccharicrinis carchari]
MNRQDKLRQIGHQIRDIIVKAREMENIYSDLIGRVHPIYSKSALNLVHYLALRSFDIEKLQTQLRYLGLPGMDNAEAHVMSSLLSVQTIVRLMCGMPVAQNPAGTISIKKSENLLKTNTNLLFGYKSTNRWTRIMVTLPTIAARDYTFINRLVKLGMNSARINCAHDHPAVWIQMINHIKQSNKASKKNCKIVMDLAGPKLRTGAMKPGPQILRFKPERDLSGKVTKPAKLWIAPPDVFPPDDTADAIIPVDARLLKKIKRGDTIHFTDARGKKNQILIDRKQGEGKWGLCHYSAYLKTGTELKLNKVKQTGREKSFVGELLALEQFILLCKNDLLIVHKEPIPGEPAKYDRKGKLIAHAHISCTLPEVFDDVKPGEAVFFNDGKIEGVIEAKEEGRLRVKITHAKKMGSKLRGGKGINFPDSHLNINGLTAKDKEDMNFVGQWADVVNLSFVNQASDVEAYLTVLGKIKEKPGLIVKIETFNGFRNLPEILLCAMQIYPVGIMIARGDLAIETGWKNFASIQEEIMRVGDAAHIPAVWATQVLESMAKNGVPTRSEITDAVLAQRAECVMLNKGAYIEKTVNVLDSILKKMQKHGYKKQMHLPKLEEADRLKLSL